MAEKGRALGVKTKPEMDDARTSLTQAQLDHLAARAALERSMGVSGEEG